MKWPPALRLAPILLVLGFAATPQSLAGVSSLLLDSEPGEFIGQGEFNFYTSEDSSFLVQPQDVDYARWVSISVGGWYLSFGAPEGETLAPGVYEVPSQDDPPYEAGLSVSGNQRGCVGVSGQFEVKQIAFDTDGRLEKLWVTFEQLCVGLALRGDLRVNADPPIVIDAPSRQTAFEERALSIPVEGRDDQGSPIQLSATGMPPGATFNDAGDGTGRFDWIPAPGQAGVYWIAWHGESAGGGDSDAVYTHLEVLPDFDNIDHAIPIRTVPFRAEIDSPDAGVDPDDPTCMSAPLATIWYSYTPAEDGYIAANLSPPRSGGPGLSISIYAGERGRLEQLGCGFHFARAGVTAGQTYYIMIGMYEVPTQQFTFDVIPLPPPPANDDFAAATVVAALPFEETIDTANTSSEPGDPPTCGGPAGALLGAGVWYVYAPTAETRVTIDTGLSSFGARQIGVFTGRHGALAGVTCGVSRLSFTAHPGKTYHVAIAAGGVVIGPGYGGAPGSGVPISNPLHVSFTGRPALGIGVTVAREGVVDLRSGVAVLQGSATCSRPATIVLLGTLVKGRGSVRGNFETTIACTGAGVWRVELIAETTRGPRGRFMAGPAEVLLNASAVPGDNPDDLATEDDRTAVVLRGARLR